MPDGGFLGEMDLKTIKAKEPLAVGWVLNQSGYKMFRRNLKASLEENNSNMLGGLVGVDLTWAVRALAELGYQCKSVNNSTRVYKNPLLGTLTLESAGKVKTVEFVKA